MATWKADIKTTSTGSIYSVTVEAGASYVAKQEIERLYRPIFIQNLRQVHNDSGSSGSDVSGGASVVGIGLLAACFAFVYFTPWVLMFILGGFATWVGEVVTNQSLEEYTQRDDDFGHRRAALVVVLALLAGGFGFIKGDEIKKGFDAPDTPAEVKKAQ